MYFAVILDPTMKSDMIEIGFRHLIENGFNVPMMIDNDGETFLNDDEVCEKMVKTVEKDMRLLFNMYKEKYGTKEGSDLPKATSSENTNTSRRRCNSFFKEKVGSRLSVVEDELTKYLKEPRLELEDNEDFYLLTWWKLNSPRFSIVSKMAHPENKVHPKWTIFLKYRCADHFRNILTPRKIIVK